MVMDDRAENIENTEGTEKFSEVAAFFGLDFSKISRKNGHKHKLRDLFEKKFNAEQDNGGNLKGLRGLSGVLLTDEELSHAAGGYAVGNNENEKLWEEQL